MSTNTSVPSVFPSVMRTLVPIVAGAVITVLAHIGVDFGSEATTTVATAVITGAYYTLFRLLERVAPTGGTAEKIFGLLLGFARPPVYPVSGTIAASARVESLTAPRPPTNPSV